MFEFITSLAAAWLLITYVYLKNCKFKRLKKMMVILSEKDIQNAKTRKFRNLVYTKYKIQEPRRKAFKMNGDFKGCVISYTFIEYENVTLEEAENLAQAEMEKDDYCYIEICGYGK